MLRRGARHASLPASRLVCTTRLKGTEASKEAAAAAKAIKQAPEFGTNVASEDSAAQLMHDAQRGKFKYVSDFASSLNTGPVKLSFKDAPKTQEDEAQERALSMIQRSVLVGSLAVLASGVIGWQITKWYMGVSNAKVSRLDQVYGAVLRGAAVWRGVARCGAASQTRAVWPRVGRSSRSG